MVPDGMGLAVVTAARIFKNGPDGDRLSFEKMPVIGYQSTHSADSTVTDSAAAASAWANGEKYNIGEISCHDDDVNGACDGQQAPTLLDLAKAKGKSTGLVVTLDITHGTPAAFGANVHNRKCEEEIARQYLSRNIDVLLGGGIAKNRSTCMLPYSSDDYLDDLLADYTAAGYTLVRNEDEMKAAVDDGAAKLLGLFKAGGKTQEMFRVNPATTYPEGEPTLPEMTKTALAILEKNRNGFFLVVEGSQIDWANHALDFQGQLAETLAFDQAVETVLEWMNAGYYRRVQTLVVVVADHETGGFAINGPHDSLSEQGGFIEDAWISDRHTGVDTLIWAQGPGSQKFGQALDNDDGIVRYGHGIGQNMLTPGDLSNPNPPQGDLPYAGTLTCTLNWQNFNRRSARNLQVSIGILGEESFADCVQTFVHEELLGMEEPQGWDTQRKTEPIVNLAYGHLRRLAYIGRYNDGWAGQVALAPSIHVGNLFTAAELGLALRFGWNIQEGFSAYPAPPGRGIFQGSHLPKPATASPHGIELIMGARACALVYTVVYDGSILTSDDRSVDRNTIIFAGGFGINYHYYKRFSIRLSLLYNSTVLDEESLPETLPGQDKTSTDNSYGTLVVDFHF